ncbi:hypothetical protein V8F06_012670 [Rhypophila decipiens]
MQRVTPRTCHFLLTSFFVFPGMVQISQGFGRFLLVTAIRMVRRALCSNLRVACQTAGPMGQANGLYRLDYY